MATTEHKGLSEALAAAQAEYPSVVKGQFNPHFRSHYADLSDGMGSVRPVLAKHGIAYTQTFHVADGTLLLRTKLRWRDECEVSELPIHQPGKPQDFVSLTTYYRRIALFSICGITPAGEDDDGNRANDVAHTKATTSDRPRPSPPARAKGNGKAPSPEEEVAVALGERPAGAGEPERRTVALLDLAGLTVRSSDSPRELLEAYYDLKAAVEDKAGFAELNLDLLRYAAQWCKGGRLLEVRKEIAMGAAAAEDGESRRP